MDRWPGRSHSGAATVIDAGAKAETSSGARSRWPNDDREAMTALAMLFPSVREAAGVDPWDVRRFVLWLNCRRHDDQAKWVGRFLLGVWSGPDWRLGPGDGGEAFDLVRAARCWDSEHLKALTSWMEEPFWPSHDAVELTAIAKLWARMTRLCLAEDTGAGMSRGEFPDGAVFPKDRGALMAPLLGSLRSS
jgi:hypothetical protein